MKRIFEAIALTAWAQKAGINPDTTRVYIYPLSRTSYGDVRIAGDLPHQSPQGLSTETVRLESVIPGVYLGYGPLTDTLVIGQMVR